MEENCEQKNNEYHYHHNWKKYLAMMLGTFLGGLVAFYFVFDQMAERYYRNHLFMPHNIDRFEKKMFNDMEKSYRHEMKHFDDIFKKELPKIDYSDLAVPLFMMDAVKIRTEFEDNNFNVIVDLKPFQGNIDKINYNLTGRKLTVFGSSEVKDKTTQQDISFSQDFLLPSNADKMKIKKYKDGKDLIISVPLKN